MLSSIATIFFVPLIFSQQDYGFYKLFLLYVSYVGIFHFGFIDGIYLFYGGKKYEDLDKNKFSKYTKFLFLTQLIISLIIFIFGLSLNGDRKVIMMLVSANLIILNLTSYYQFISQITGRFKEFAFRNIVFTIFNLLLIGFFLLLKIDNYLVFILFSTIINLVLLSWYMITYKDITFVNNNGKIKDDFKDIKFMFNLGIPLLFSNLIIMFMSNLPKQFIEIVYPIEKFPAVFSNFSFAFTLIGFTSVFLTAISLVLYPTLRKSDMIMLKKSYNKFDNGIIVLIFLAIVFFYPLSYLIKIILPEYLYSLKIFFILCPGIALTSSISVIKHNYYKAIDKNVDFLIIGIINVVLLVVLMIITYFFISKDIILISVISVFTQFIMFLSTDIILQKTLKTRDYKKVLYIVVSSLLFYLMIFIESLVISMFIYLIGIIIISLIFYIKEIFEIIKYFKKGKVLKENNNF